MSIQHIVPHVPIQAKISLHLKPRSSTLFSQALSTKQHQASAAAHARRRLTHDGICSFSVELVDSNYTPHTQATLSVCFQVTCWINVAGYLRTVYFGYICEHSLRLNWKNMSVFTIRQNHKRRYVILFLSLACFIIYRHFR